MCSLRHVILIVLINCCCCSEGADDITEDSVITEVNDTDASVRITWSEPERPNGAIISYGILLWEAKNVRHLSSIMCISI